MTEIEARVVAETADYLVVAKPRGMHSAPLSEGEENTVLAWSAAICPAVLTVRGRKPVERGLLHRLDLDTEGLVLLAKSQKSYDFLNDRQERGLFVKTYEAVCIGPPDAVLASQQPPFVVESGFRPFGPGRKAVRPVPIGEDGEIRSSRGKETALDRGMPYRTTVESLSPVGGGRTLARASLARGFRHQVRCHLAWIGLPLAGDRLYGGSGGEPLALRAVALEFPLPDGSGTARYEIESFFS